MFENSLVRIVKVIIHYLYAPPLALFLQNQELFDLKDFSSPLQILFIFINFLRAFIKDHHH